MGDLIDTTEMYLKTIFEMEEDGVTPLRARIVERLEHSGPTVSQTVSRMERDGLVHVLGDRRLELTPEGRRQATEVVRKHRLAERLLIDVIGLEWKCAHEEACRLLTTSGWNMVTFGPDNSVPQAWSRLVAQREAR
mgnify:CR=1 FL=1